MDKNMTSAASTVGEKLISLRNLFGLSQRELCRRAGMTNSTLSMIEQGKTSPSIFSLEKLLGAFPVTIETFFTLNSLVLPPVLRRNELRNISTENAISHVFELVSGGQAIANAASNSMGAKCVNHSVLARVEIESGIKTTLPVLEALDAKVYVYQGVVASGTLLLSIDTIEYTLDEGDAFNIGSSREYAFHNFSDKRAVLCWCCQYLD